MHSSKYRAKIEEMVQRWWVLAAVACGTFMATLDSSIVNIVLPSLAEGFRVNIYQIKWVVIAYLLVITCFLLPFGRVSDQYGRRRVFLLGFATFTVGSTICGFCKDLWPLVLARVFQAFGASMLMANGPAIITSAFPARERGTALGVLGMVVSLGLISGPSVGGILIHAFGWNSIFLVNIPVGLLGMALVLKYVKREVVIKTNIPFDWVGVVLQALTIFLFILFMEPPQIAVSGGLPFQIPRWLLAGLLLLFGAVFIRVERDAPAPIFDQSLLANRTFWCANLAGFLTFVSFSSVTVLMPFYLEQVLSLAPHRSGFLMSAIPLTIFVMAPISGRLSDRIGSRGLSLAGACVGCITLATMSGVLGPGLTSTSSELSISLMLSCLGLGVALFQSPNNNAIMASVPYEKLSVASALLATVRNLGLVAGTGISTGIFTWSLSTSPGDFVGALHGSMWVATFFGLGAVVASMPKRQAYHPPEDASVRTEGST